MIFLEAAIAYLLCIWVGLRLVVPHLGFRKEPLPETIPQNFEARIKKIGQESQDNFDFLKRAYAFVTTTYTGGRIRTITNFWVAFEDPVNHAPGFLPCNAQNYLLRLILVKSGRFQDSDIEVRTIPLNIFIHQYLRVQVDGRTIDVDPWSSFLGIPIGKKSAYIG